MNTQNIIIVTVLFFTISLSSSKPVLSDESERQKLINEVAEAELAAKRLKNLLKELTKYSKKREHNRALSKIELVPHEFEPIEVIDLSDIGDPDTYEVADRFVDKRSKNFMKLVNQAARGFGRK